MNDQLIVYLVGGATILLSTGGMYLAGLHYMFFRNSQDPLAKLISRVFLSDLIIYILTVLFGLWAFFSLGFIYAIALQIFRIPGLAFNIFASYMLHSHYKKIINSNK